MSKFTPMNALIVPLCAAAILTGCQDSTTDPASESTTESTTSAVTTAAEQTETTPETPPTPAEQGLWTVGFGSAEIPLPENPATPLYIAGYNQGWEIGGVRDLQRANAVWLNTPDSPGGILLISVDCVALSSNYVETIRNELADFTKETGCTAINVVSTHTHAGIDTLGLWGPLAIDGKNAAFMDNVITAAVSAAKAAYADRSQGTLGYASVETVSMQRDSRDPQSYDPNLHQIRFTPGDDAQNGVRIMIYDAHAESLRGDNTMVSRDYPGVMSDIIREKTGDDMLFLPGAIGGLIMTKVLVEPFDAEQNLTVTGQRMADYALSMDPADDLLLPPTMTGVRTEVEVPMENQVFVYYKFLGILQNKTIETNKKDEYIVKSELNLVSLGGTDGVLLNLVPGEIFPELVNGKGLRAGDPTPMNTLAAEAGYDRMLTISLSNDELGYIVPPGDFLLNEENPYFEKVEGLDENHYEETNSVGPECAVKMAEALAEALKML